MIYELQNIKGKKAEHLQAKIDKYFTFNPEAERVAVHGDEYNACLEAAQSAVNVAAKRRKEEPKQVTSINYRGRTLFPLGS